MDKPNNASLPALRALAVDLLQSAEAVHSAAVLNLAQAEKALDDARAELANGGHYDPSPLSGVNLAARTQRRALLALDDAKGALSFAISLQQVA